MILLLDAIDDGGLLDVAEAVAAELQAEVWLPALEQSAVDPLGGVLSQLRELGPRRRVVFAGWLADWWSRQGFAREHDRVARELQVLTLVRLAAIKGAAWAPVGSRPSAARLHLAQPCWDLHRLVLNAPVLMVPSLRRSIDFLTNELVRQARAGDHGDAIINRELDCALGVGPHTPTLVLVGDEVNPRTSWAGLPFDGGPAARHLHRTLTHSHLREQRCYLVNARSARGDLTRFELESLRHPGNPLPTVVALGGAAHEHLNRIGVKHRQLRHPQWEARFRRHEVSRYANQIALTTDRMRLTD